MEIAGRISDIHETEQFESGFRKRRVIIDTDEGQYSQVLPIDFVQDKTEVLNNFKIGQQVKIGINIRGNQYEGKHYVNLQGWKINAVEEFQAPQPENEQDDLPF